MDRPRWRPRRSCQLSSDMRSRTTCATDHLGSLPMLFTAKGLERMRLRSSSPLKTHGDVPGLQGVSASPTRASRMLLSLFFKTHVQRHGASTQARLDVGLSEVIAVYEE